MTVAPHAVELPDGRVDDEFRRVMGRFCTGVAVITAEDDDGPVGMAVQSLVSLSRKPPLVLFCVQKTSQSWPRIAAGGVFCANILSVHQNTVSTAFAISGADKFAGIGWRPARSGAPILDGGLAYVDCRVIAVHDGGDHHIVIGHVDDMDTTGVESPLLFYGGRYGYWNDAGLDPN